MTKKPRVKINTPIFLISLVDCLAMVNKYFCHLLGNKAGIKPSIINTKPNAVIKVSVMFPPSDMFIISSVSEIEIKKPAYLLALIMKK